MIEKIEKIPPKKRALILAICIIIIVGVYIAISGNEQRKKNTAFKNSAAETLNLYGDTIDHYNIDTGYVGVYVNPKKWAQVSEESKKDFYNEVYALLRINAIQSQTIDYQPTLAFYCDNERVAMYIIRE